MGQRVKEYPQTNKLQGEGKPKGNKPSPLPELKRTTDKTKSKKKYSSEEKTEE